MHHFDEEGDSPGSEKHCMAACDTEGEVTQKE